MNISDNRYILRWAKKIRGARLLGGRCEVCGCDDIFVLQFHHTCDKLINDHLFQNRWGFIARELKKCKLLCANCHSELHYASGSGDVGSVKERLLSIKGTDRCQVCGYKGISNASLHFHHTGDGDKRFGIAEQIRKDDIRRKWVDIVTELDKCEVLCARCHLRLSVDEKRWKKFEEIIMKRADCHCEKQSKVDRSEILRLAKDGMRVSQIARELGCTNPLVSRFLTKMRQLGKL